MRRLPWSIVLTLLISSAACSSEPTDAPSAAIRSAPAGSAVVALELERVP